MPTASDVTLALEFLAALLVFLFGVFAYGLFA